MSRKLAIFKVDNIRSHGTFFFASPLGGDVKKIGDFQVGKYVHMVSFFWHHLLGAMLRKLAVFKKGKYVPFFGKKITTE